MEYVKREDNKTIVENFGNILARKFYHLIYPNGKNTISIDEIQKVDNKEWEMFYVHYETPEAYYCTPILGMGLIDCMILKSDTREFLPKEIKTLNGKILGMYGSYTGKDSGQRWTMVIEPVVNKL